MARPSTYSPELRRRAVEEVIGRGRKIPDVARDLGIRSAETLRNWVKQERVDRGLDPDPTTDELVEIKKLRKEVADQQRTIEILKAATTYFREGGRPPFEVMSAFVGEHRESGRSSRSAWRSVCPSAAITRLRRGRFRLGRSATRSTRSRSVECGKRTTGPMGRGEYTRRCAGRAIGSPGARWNA